MGEKVFSYVSAKVQQAFSLFRGCLLNQIYAILFDHVLSFCKIIIPPL